MAGFRPYIVGIGGTTRPGSSSEKALRYALALAEARGVNATSRSRSFWVINRAPGSTLPACTCQPDISIWH